jgi:fatty-acyl-CoA synthase
VSAASHVPSEPASDGPLLTRAWWPADRRVPLVDHSVGSLLVERAATHGDALALVGRAHGSDLEVRLTYAELLVEARAVAVGLARLAEPGALVALWAPNVVEWPVIEYGVALAGMVLVALNPVLRPDELRYALNHSGASVLLYAERSRDYDLAAVVAEVAGDCPALRHVVSLAEPDRWRASPTGEQVTVDPDGPAMLQYTSGTTGKPKGVLLRHRSLVNVAKLTMETIEAEPGTGVNPLPMFHTAACVIGTLGPLWLGSAMVLVGRFEPVAVLRTIEEEQASILFFVPTVLGALLEAARTGAGPSPAIRTVLGGGANVPGSMIEAAERCFGASVHNLFGQTELAPVLTLTRRSDSRHDQVTTVGRPIPQVECRIVDPATGEVAALDQEGEICARGYQQLIGYLGDPEATARAVDAEGWVHTGDLGSMDARGMVKVTGRLKDLIIRGGENIAPAEIEAVLVTHEAVLEAAVVGLPDERWGETVAAVIRVRGTGPAPGLRDDLVAHCGARLSPFKVPQQWFVAPELPTTPSGKVQKFRLRELVLDGSTQII